MHIVDERALVDISGEILNTAQGPAEARMVTKNCANDDDGEEQFRN